MSEFAEPFKIGETKFIIFRGKDIPIDMYSDGLWRDPQMTVLALQNDKSADPITRCGVGPVFSLPVDYWMTPACKVHDYAYNSLAWQVFHTREETDALLTSIGNLLPGHEVSLTPEVFEVLARTFGERFWEYAPTNN